MAETINHAEGLYEISDKEIGSNCSVYDLFHDNSDSTALKSMCNFTASEFHDPWMGYQIT